MSHPRSLTEQEAIDAEEWFQEYERIGTFSAKARELNVTRDTLRDAIRRVRGLDTKTTRQKLSNADIDALATELIGGTRDVWRSDVVQVVHVERRQNGEEQLDTTEAMSGK